MQPKYANRMKDVKASDIREMLKAAENPEVISFAGGLPAPELFPVKEIRDVSGRVIDEMGMRALQYSSTEGYWPLRNWVAQRVNQRQGTSFNPDNVQIVHGSQQALDLSGKLFLDEGDVVLCEVPTYLAALSAFRAYGCGFVGVETDDEGMLPDALEKALADNPRAKLIYVIPDFQNPSGRTWSRARRKALTELSAKYGVMVLEDAPYAELRFAGEALPSVQALGGDNILSTGTFSKIFCPGYRIGWVIGPREIIRKYTLLKQSTDLQCNTIAQMEIAKYLEHYDIDAHIRIIRETYKRRRDLMIGMMEKEFPKNVSFTRPDGGLFAWVTLPGDMDARELLQECLKENVMFVPGGSFYPDQNIFNTLRMNYSAMPEERIEEGVKRMGAALRKHIGT